MGLNELRIQIPMSGLRSMVESVDPLLLPQGFASEIRNKEFTQGGPRRRRGWARVFDTRLPCETVINSKGGAYIDTAGRVHRLYAGSDGKLYHALGASPTTWTEVTLHQDVAWTWDASYRAVFAPHGDDCFITFWQPPEALTVPPAGAQNLRFDGLSDVTDPSGLFHAFGVSIPAPAVAPTLTPAGRTAPEIAADEGLTFGTYDYFVTLKDNVTGMESDRSPINTLAIEKPDPPDAGPTLADGGAGNLDAGVYEYAVCFLESVLGYRSELSLPTQITHDALSKTTLTNIRRCPLAGATWHREVYRRRAGGIWNRHITLANNTTETATDNTQADSGVEYAEGAVAVAVSAIPLYGAGGTPVNGRDIYRCIYRQDNGAGYRRLTIADAELLNNTGTTYRDVIDTPHDDAETWTRQAPVPLCGLVCAGPDGRLLYIGDKPNALPAQMYPAVSDALPEAVAVDEDQHVIVTYKAGTQDDPATACEDARDGWMLGKRRGIYYVTRECTNCERLLKDRGNVAPGSMQVVDSRAIVLTMEGPGYPDDTMPGGFRFCGPNLPNESEPNTAKFCMTTTWGSVVKSRLPYASSFHMREQALIGWAVQCCADWPVGPHNDTVILWDYSIGGGGRISIMDMPGLDCFMQVPSVGGGPDTIEACFAYGVVARLFDGDHNDGVTGITTGTILDVNGNVINVATADLGGQDVVGSIVWVTAGSGKRDGDMEICESVRALIIGYGGSPPTGVTELTLAGVIPVAVGDTFEIGGFQDRLALPVNAGNPMSMKTWLTLHARTN